MVFQGLPYKEGDFNIWKSAKYSHDKASITGIDIFMIKIRSLSSLMLNFLDKI